MFSSMSKKFPASRSLVSNRIESVLCDLLSSYSCCCCCRRELGLNVVSIHRLIYNNKKRWIERVMGIQTCVILDVNDLINSNRLITCYHLMTRTSHATHRDWISIRHSHTAYSLKPQTKRLKKAKHINIMDQSEEGWQKRYRWWKCCCGITTTSLFLEKGSIPLQHNVFINSNRSAYCLNNQLPTIT